jgi:hypothetical protein
MQTARGAEIMGWIGRIVAASTEHGGVSSIPMARIRSVIDRLTYANVVATLALFVSLGGASYAAVALPAGSVGRKQLQARAIDLGALSFPLGSAGAVDRTPEDLTKNGCNGGSFSGNAAPPCPPERHNRAIPASEIHIRTAAPGRLSLMNVANLRNEGAPQTTARVTLWLAVDGHTVAESEVPTSGGQALQVPIQASASISRGIHSAGLGVSAHYSSSGPGDVVVTSSTLIVNASPGLAHWVARQP